MNVYDKVVTNSRKRLALTAATCGVFLLTLAQYAGAQTLLSGNLGSGYQTDTGQSWANGGADDSANAVSFTNTDRIQAYTLNSIQFADNYFVGTNTLNIGFYQGSDLNSATLLESFSVTAPNAQTADLFTVKFLDPVIQPGETYFIAQTVTDVAGDTTWGWQYNNMGDTGYFSKKGADPWFAETAPDAFTPAYAVYGDLVTTSPPAVPEPSSFLLLGTGFAGIAAHLRRRLKRS